MENYQEVIVPKDVTLQAAKATSSLLPTKSEAKYEKEYHKFCEWRNERKVKGVNEDVILAYVSEKAKQYGASSLWSYHSMLKSTLLVHERVNIDNFTRVHAFLKKQNVSHEPKKSNVLTREQITHFLTTAPDKDFLLIKIVTIFGICGACRCDEMYQMTTDDVEDKGSYLLVTIPSSHSKTHKGRRFTILPEGLGINPLALFRKYVALRPVKVAHKNLFVFYRKEKCSVQRVGINSFYRYPKLIASFLKLEDPESYSGHCFRRSSTTLLANAGADILRLKRHGGWRSSSIAESYVEDSLTEKMLINRKIMVEKNSNTNLAKINSNELNSTYVSYSGVVMGLMGNTKDFELPDGVVFQNVTNCTFNIHVDSKK